jgi:hypothetical protein
LFSTEQAAALPQLLNPLLSQNDSENALLLDKDFFGEQSYANETNEKTLE